MLRTTCLDIEHAHHGRLVSVISHAPRCCTRCCCKICLHVVAPPTQLKAYPSVNAARAQDDVAICPVPRVTSAARCAAGVTEAERKRSESLDQATALPPPPGADAGTAAESSTSAASRGLPPLPSISTVRVPSDPAVPLRRLPSAEAGPPFKRTEARQSATSDLLLLSPSLHDPLARSHLYM